MNRIVQASLLVAGMAGLASLVSCTEPAPEPVRDLGPKRVRVAAVEQTTDARTLRFSGTARSVQRGAMAFQISGRIATRPVEIGQRVERGDVLATLDAREARNAVATAEAAAAEVAARLKQGKLQLQRIEELAASGAATTEELEITRATAEGILAAEAAAAARLREARRVLGEGVLRAPYAATVVETHLEAGEQASPGRSVVSLAGDGGVELVVEVPESLVGSLREGDGLDVAVPRLGETVRGRVERVARAAAGAGSLFPVTVRLPDTASVPVGATAELMLPLAVDDALTVPVEAVVDPGGRRPAVFRIAAANETAVDQAVVEKVEVEVGALVAGRVVVRGPLVVGDRVVVGGQRGLLDGEPVQIDPAASAVAASEVAP